MEGNFRMKAAREFWGLRPWKRHDLILSVAGAMYALVGVSYILAVPRASQYNALEVLLRIAPLDFWGSVFVLAGALSMISSRWPPFAETWGYMVLTGISAGWGSTYLLGIIFANSSWTNVNGFIIWSLLGFLWWAISGLLNPDKTGAAEPDGPS